MVKIDLITGFLGSGKTTFIKKYANLPSNYYTIDYAQLEDDSWIIIECGDGQVSGLSDSQDYLIYYKNLIQCFE